MHSHVPIHSHPQWFVFAYSAIRNRPQWYSSSDTIYSTYFNSDEVVSDYFTIAAIMRNYFYDHYSYDYSMQQLQAIISGNAVLREEPLLDNIVYTIQQFKKNNHHGIDRYADYREKERDTWETILGGVRREAKEYYDTYSSGAVKESASHKRFIEYKYI